MPALAAALVLVGLSYLPINASTAVTQLMAAMVPAMNLEDQQLRNWGRSSKTG
jgi:hypothetical protein